MTAGAIGLAIYAPTILAFALLFVLFWAAFIRAGARFS